MAEARREKGHADGGRRGTRRRVGRVTGVATIRVDAVMSSAEESGLFREKSGRIGGRVNPKLIERAKANTGITSDTELLDFALANVALEDNFAEAFREVRGAVDPELKLGF